MSTSTVSIAVQVDGVAKAITDLGAVDRAVKEVGRGTSDLGKTGSDVALVGGALARLCDQANTGAKAVDAVAESVDKAAAAGKRLGSGRVWDSYRQGASEAKSSTEALAKSLGTVRAAANASGLKSHNAEIERMARLCGLSTSSITNMVRQMDAARRTQAFEGLRQSANLSTIQLAKLQAEMGDMRGAFGTLVDGAGRAKLAIAAVGAVLLLAGKSCLDATLQADRLNKAYASITGSSSGAVVQLEQIRTTADRLGLQFQSTAESAKTFFAAGKDTKLEPEMNRIFEAVSTAGSALSLSTEQMQGSFLALGQMISKGKVQAEELRGQLGERLPGAFQLAAKAMNMTTAELDKFMADGKLTAEVLLPKLATVLENEFGAAAIKASQGVQGAVNRLSTEWEAFKASLIDSSAAAAGIDAVRSAVAGLRGVVDLLKRYGAEIKAVIAGAIMGSIVAMSPAIVAAGVQLAALIPTLAGLKAGLAGLSAFLVANPWIAAGIAVGTVATALYLYAQHADTATQAQQALDDAQRASITINKELADSQKESAEAMKDRLDAARQTQKDLEGAIVNLREKLSENADIDRASPWMHYMSGMNEFSGKLKNLLEEAGRTGDFEKLGKSLVDLELEARAAGKDTSDFSKQIENAQDIAALGIKLGITVTGWGETIRKLELLNAARYNNLEDKRAEERIILLQREEAGMAKTLAEYQKHTDAGRLEVLQSQGKELRQQLADLNHSLLPAEKRTEQAKMLNALLKDNSDKISKINKKGDKKDTALEQARRNAESYKAEMDKAAASVDALKAQLAAPAEDVVTRNQVKIVKEYEQAVADITKEVANYASKKGVSAAQAEELKTQKLLEAQLKKTLALRDAESQNAEIRLDFEKRYADMVGATSQGVIDSIKKQSAEYASAGADRVRLAEWERDQIQRASHDAWDGAAVALRDYSAEASNQAKGMNEAFSGLFSGIDSGFKNVWGEILEDGKVSLSSFRSLFASFLADLMHMAVTRPITVSIAGVVSGGLFGGTGTANAGGTASGSGGFSLPGASSLTSFLPDSLTSGVSNFMSTPLPGSFGFVTNGATPLSMASGLSVGSALGYGAAGGLGYSLLGGALGLPQNKYTGITSGLGGTLGAWGGSALGTALGTSGAISGAMAGSVAFPIVGTILGALGGGLLGGLFGTERKTRPSVYTRADDLKIDSDYDYTAAFQQGAWYDRAGKEEADKVMPVLGEAAKVAAAQVEALVAALPEEFRGQVEKEIGNATFAAGRGVAGMDKSNWNFQFYDEDQLKERLEAVVKDIQLAMGQVAQEAMDGIDMSSMYTFDLGTSEGMDRAVKAVTSVKEITEATKAIAEPASQLVEQAKAAKTQMEEWTASMKEYGVVGDYAKELVDEYRQASIDSYIKSLEESIDPTSQYEQAVKAANKSVDDHMAALKEMGATEEEVARVEKMRADVLEATAGALLADFDQSMRIRELQLSGSAELLTSTQFAIQQEAELAEVRAKFGESSSQYAQAVDMQTRELAAATRELAAARLQFQAEYSIRVSEAGGQDTTLARLTMQQESEIQQIIAKFGQNSKEYYDMLTLHRLEYEKAMEQAAQNSTAAAESSGRAWQSAVDQVKQAEQAILQYTYDMVDQLQQKMRDVLKAYVDQATTIYDKAQDAFTQGLKRDMDKLSSSIDGFGQAVDSLRSAQKDIWQQNATPSQSYASLTAEMQALYAKAAGGDVDAAGELASLTSKWLDASYQSQSDFAGYEKDRLEANKMLGSLAGILDGQKSEAQKQLDALQSIYDALVEPEKSLDKLLTEFIAARVTLDKTLNQQGDYYGKWQLGDLHGELGDIDFSTIKGSESISDYIQKNGKEAIAHLLGLSGDLGSLEDSTVKNLLDMIGGVDNLDTETKKQTDVFEAKLAENIHELYSSIQSLQALELELSKANADKLDAINKYGTLQVTNKLTELQNALVAAIKNQASVPPPSTGGGGSSGGGGSTTPTKPTGALSQSQILTHYAPEVATQLSNGSLASFSAWWESTGKYLLASKGVSWNAYQGSAYHSSNFLGSKFATEALLLKAKTVAVNRDRFEGRNNWSESEVRNYIQKNGGWAYWYAACGKAEGFARGGITPPDRPFWVGEQGPELMMSSRRFGVVNSRASMALAGQALPQRAKQETDTEAKKEVAGLREEVGGMKRIFTAILAVLDRSDANTKRIKDKLEMWDAEGTPQERKK